MSINNMKSYINGKSVIMRLSSGHLPIKSYHKWYDATSANRVSEQSLEASLFEFIAIIDYLRFY
jgi:hypothetical protein